MVDHNTYPPVDNMETYDFLYPLDGQVYPGSSGCQTTCEGQGLDKQGCEQKTVGTAHVCYFSDKIGKCFSKVRDQPCPTSPGEMSTRLNMIEGDIDFGLPDDRA